MNYEQVLDEIASWCGPSLEGEALRVERKRRKERKQDDLSLQDIELLDVPEITPKDEQRARLAVCGTVQDATVARNLLDVLGLLP